MASSWILFFTVIGFTFIVISNAQSQVIQRDQKLSDRVSVSWTIDFSIETATFQVTAETHGFIGFGLSPQGGMNNADVIIGGVLNDGTPYFTDRFATGKMEPKIDDHQDWYLLQAFENETHTVLTFNRSLITCDPEDLPITEDTTKFIWSLGATDQIVYHEQRGASSVFILDPAPPAADTSMFDIWKVEVNTTIPTKDTTYWCTVHKSPNFTSKRHMVGFKVDLESPLALTHNHHLVFHSCPAQPGSEMGNVLESYVGGPGGDCYDDRDMVEVIDFCSIYLYVWAKGGDVLLLPDHVGLPLNKDGLEEYFVLEIHYDNPSVLEGVQYETGIEVFTTASLRPQDAGMLKVAHSADISLIVPHSSQTFTVVGHCSPTCTTAIPTEGLNIFNILLHAHLSGRQLKLRHFRPNAVGHYIELPWTFDANYDFNYQQNRFLKEYMKLMPGDQLSYECTYNSTWRSPPSVTFGGPSTTHEMCEAFMMYYPLNPQLDVCKSQVILAPLLQELGIEEWDETSDVRDPTVSKPDSLAGKKFSTILDTLIDWTEEYRQQFQQRTRFSDHYATCYGSYNFTSKWDFPSPFQSTKKSDTGFVNYPINYEAYEPPQLCSI